MRAELLAALLAEQTGGREPSPAEYAAAYARPDYAWHVASWLAERQEPLPVAVDGADQWVFRAWLHRLDPARFPDRELTAVLALRTPKCRRLREALQALLVAASADPVVIARQLGVDPRVVEGYERLFWSVLDRRDEAHFIASLVYPNTRLVELFEGYLQNETLGNLLLRAGYNNGARDVLHFAGMLPDGSRVENPGELASKLEAVLMGNGFLLARNGLIGQGLRGVEGARGLIAAAKHGGQETTSSLVPAEAGERIYEDILASSRLSGAAQLPTRPPSR